MNRAPFASRLSEPGRARVHPGSGPVRGVRGLRPGLPHREPASRGGVLAEDPAGEPGPESAGAHLPLLGGLPSLREPTLREGVPLRGPRERERTAWSSCMPNRCIGCRYCEMACPFGAPSFDAAAGVMTKCHLCHHRLAEGGAGLRGCLSHRGPWAFLAPPGRGRPGQDEAEERSSARRWKSPGSAIRPGPHRDSGWPTRPGPSGPGGSGAQSLLGLRREEPHGPG